jgi:HPt (histidine-containing phosphotransfer) domain-containing protein
MENQTDNEQALLRRLKELTEETDADFVRELAELFISSFPSAVEAISSALAHEQFEEARAAAHALKGSSLNLGSVGVGNLARGIEQSAKNNDGTHCLLLLQQLKEIGDLEVNKILAFIGHP